MRNLLPLPAVSLLLLLGACAGGGAGVSPDQRERAAKTSTGADTRPNVVLILADDLGYADLGVQGAADIPTPNLDALARAGVQCTDAYVSAPLCFPSRAALVTGRYAQRFGVEHNASVAGFELPLDETTLAERFSAAGYATGLIGKWNLGTVGGRDPMSRGFDEFFGFDALAHPYTGNDRDRPQRKRGPLMRGHERVLESEYLTDAFARESRQFIERHVHEPFFLFVSLNAPHTPLQSKETDRARFASWPDTSRAAYAAMVVSLDDAVGTIDDALRDAGLRESTLVLFLSDNGASPRAGGRNDPFRGAKGTLWEGGIRVPWLVRWASNLPGGAIDPSPVMQIDVAPTVLAAAGVTFDRDAFDGADRLSLWSGGRGAVGPLFWRYSGGEEMAATNAWAVREGPWKLGIPTARERDGEPTQDEGRLIHLGNDPFESLDLAAGHPEVVARLRLLWQEWNGTLPEPRGFDPGGRP